MINWKLPEFNRVCLVSQSQVVAADLQNFPDESILGLVREAKKKQKKKQQNKLKY